MQIAVEGAVTIHANPVPHLLSRQAVFPGVVALPGGDLLAMFSIGQAFDAADMRAVVSRSADGGATWDAPVPLHSGTALESESFKPVVLPDGRVLATGYVFQRPDMTTPIIDPETHEILPLRNRIALSRDGGRSWDAPRDFSVEGAPLELSGPAIVLPSGRLLAVAAPFSLAAEGQEGWIIASDDDGATWQRLSVFYRGAGGTVAPWECRLCHMGGGRVAVIFWAYDAVTQTSLDNHIALSRDSGQSFAPAIATGIMGQASNMLALGPDRVLSIHCHRDPPVSLMLRVLHLDDGGIRVLAECPIFTAPDGGGGGAGVVEQFANLRFGQPGLVRLDADRYLATCWMVEKCQHVIKGYHLRVRGAG